MNLKKIFTTILVLASGILASGVYAESSVWKISKGDKYFYLGGTIHVLNAKDYPLPLEFMNAYKDSDQLIFETDLTASKTPEFQKKFLSIMTYDTDKTIKDDLNEETYSKLEKFLSSRNIPIENFSKFHPWAITLVITVIEYQRIGMLPEYGVDEYFTNLAITDNKELGYLESPDEQIAFIKSMEKIEPNMAVEYALRDLNELPILMNELKNSWRTGDIKSFETNSSTLEMKNDFPDLYKLLVTNRNKDWMTDLSALNDNDTKEFVLVGALHLCGKDGLLNQLRRAGFKVDQLKMKDPI